MKIEIYLDLIFTIIIIIGVFGNILNVLVLQRKSIKTISTFRFLFYLSIIDLFILIIIATDSLIQHSFEIAIRLLSTPVCKIHVFLTYYLTHFSSNLLMIVSLERLFMIHNKQLYCFKLNLANKFVLCLAIILALVDCHYLYFFSLSQEFTVEYNNTNSFNCSNDVTAININRNNISDEWYNNTNTNCVKQKTSISTNDSHNSGMPFSICYPLHNPQYSYFLDTIWVWIDSSLYSFIPFLVMTISSFFIIYEILQTSKRITRTNTNRRISEAHVNRNKHILYMLLITNFFFIFLSFPYSISNNNIISISENSLYIAHMLAYTNNSINFIFFYSFSVKYRSAFSELIYSFNCKKNRMKPRQDVTLHKNETHLEHTKLNIINDYNKNFKIGFKNVIISENSTNGVEKELNDNIQD